MKSTVATSFKICVILNAIPKAMTSALEMNNIYIYVRARSCSLSLLVRQQLNCSYMSREIPWVAGRVKEKSTSVNPLLTRKI